MVRYQTLSRVLRVVKKLLFRIIGKRRIPTYNQYFNQRVPVVYSHDGMVHYHVD